MMNALVRKIKRRPFPLNFQALRQCRISYSQQGEDLYITTLLGYEKSEGTYVDIGCCKPIHYSNTYIFYERGWNGLAIDPNPQFQDEWRRYRPRDTFLNYSIAREHKRMAYMRHRSGPEKNTVIEECEIANFDIAEWEHGTCEALPLSEILSRHLDHRQIDLMDIDCEGMDLEVLKSNDFDRFRPTVIAVEDHSMSPDSDIAQFLVDLNYDLRASIGITKVFKVRKG